MTIEEQWLCNMLANQPEKIPELRQQNSDNVKRLIYLARQQGVQTLLYHWYDRFPEQQQGELNQELQKNARHLYYMLYYSRYFAEQLLEAGISVVVLKGCWLAGLYELPESRSFGDIDFMLCDSRQLEEADALLRKVGCVHYKQQDSAHHIEYLYQDRLLIELHSAPVRAFANAKINTMVQRIFTLHEEDITTVQVLGYLLPVMRDGKNALYLLLHMLQHFLNAGFGLRLLCDWCVFWDRDIEFEECQQYLESTRTLGLEGFSRTVTQLCVRYLGLDRERVRLILEPGRDFSQEAELLMEDALAAGRFGETSSNRVVTVQNSSLKSMWLEFHHEMKANYPKASRCVALWPALWIGTGYRFAVNNRRVRKTSMTKVLANARKRAKIAEKMELWQ